MIKDCNKEIMVRIDEVGRIVIPKKYREALGIKYDNSLLLSLEDKILKIRKYENKDYLFFIYENFATIWIANYKDDTIVITDLDEIKYVLGKNKKRYLYNNLNKNILSIINDKNFTYQTFENTKLFDNEDYLNFDVCSLYTKDNRAGSIIIIYDNVSVKYNFRFIFELLNNCSLF